MMEEKRLGQEKWRGHTKSLRSSRSFRSYLEGVAAENYSDLSAAEDHK